jgi:PAS domain S-box
MEIKNSDLLSKILDTTSLCIFWKDNERRFIGANQAFLDFYGFKSLQVILGKTDEDMGWHSDPDPFRNDEWKVLREGISTERVHGKCVIRGEEKDIIASKSPIYEDGRIIGLVGTFEDVTNDYRQRDVIRQLTETLDNIPCGICIGKFKYGSVVISSANEFVGTMLGIDPRELIDRQISHLSSLIHPEDSARWNADAESLFKEACSMDDVYRFRNKKTDSYQWIRMKGIKARLKNDEEFLYFTFINEDELKNSEGREIALRKMFSSSVDSAKLVVWEYDIPTHTVTFAKTGYTAQRCKELGLSLEYTDVPAVMYQMVDQKYHNEIKRFFDDTFAGKLYTTADIEFQPADKSMSFFLHLSHVTMMDSSGRPIKAYGTSQDMTKALAVEKQYEHELVYISMENEKGFVAKGHHDLSANKVLGYYKANEYSMDASGMTYDEAFHKLDQFIFSDADKEVYHDIFDRNHLITRFHNGETFFSMEFRRTGSFQSAIWAQMEIRTFQNPNTGNVECFIYSYDITEKHLRQQLTNNLRMIGYKSIGLVSVPDHQASFFVPSGSHGEWTRSYSVTDYDAYVLQLISSSVPDQYREETKNNVCFCHVLEQLADHESYTYTCSFINEEGNLRRLYLYFTYLEEQHNVVSVSVQDITEQYQKEQEQIRQLMEAKQKGDEANRAKSDFLSRMSHDIRTPLNGIIGMTYLAKDENDPVKIDEYLNKIDTSSKFLLGLVNDVLDMSKIESRKIELHPEPYLSQKFVEYLNAVVKPLCQEKGQQLIIDTQLITDAVPLMDVLRVNQIFFNLFSNAVKYTPEGGTITYTLVETMIDGGRMNLRAHVVDNGIGMSEELQKVIFDPFTQGERSDTASNRGTGLGLAIVKSLIELMGGTISVESSLGNGSDFFLEASFDTVPVSEVTVEKDIQQKKDLTNLKSKHILLCEDHPLNQEITKKILESRGMIVTIAANGSEGLEAFKHSSADYYDLILMDIRMPIMDGYAATKAVRSLYRRDAETIPIIAMTADAFEDDVQKCLAAGMNAHLSKPIDPNALYDKIASFL